MRTTTNGRKLTTVGVILLLVLLLLVVGFFNRRDDATTSTQQRELTMQLAIERYLEARLVVVMESQLRELKSLQDRNAMLERLVAQRELESKKSDERERVTSEKKTKKHKSSPKEQQSIADVTINLRHFYDDWIDKGLLEIVKPQFESIVMFVSEKNDIVSESILKEGYWVGFKIVDLDHLLEVTAFFIRMEHSVAL